jgi:hypothetical protein
MERIDGVQHVWDENNDRWIYIASNSVGRIIGLNYMQGDEYKFFLGSHACIDKGLTEFYEAMADIFPVEKKSVSPLTFINQCMWAYHSAISIYQEREY